MEQCLWDEDFPETSRLAQCENLNLSLVADRKGDEALQAFKFNEEKSLNWLRKKVEKVVHVLKEKGIHVSQGAMSATYVKSTKFEIGTEAGERNIVNRDYNAVYVTKTLDKIKHLRISRDIKSRCNEILNQFL